MIVRGVVLALALLVGSAPSAEAAVPQVWKVAHLIYTEADATCNGKRVMETLTSSEAYQAGRRAVRYRLKSENWADGRLDIQSQRFWVGKVTRVTPLWDGMCWVTPDDVVAMGDWPKGFDSVIVQHAGAFHGYGGLSHDGFEPYGSTYATVPAWNSGAFWWNDEHAGAGYLIHEWLHGVGGYYRRSFPGLADLHSVADDKAFLSQHITYEMWNSGSPRQP